jgi:DnaJ-class molecular chaperone|tara:strand:+ start:588 stop:755 length:168 start_codon:yes stop_codon:yes gene_type:complete
MIIEQKECQECFGEGVVPILKIVSVSGDRMHSELEEIGKEECPDCNGTGKEVEWV